MILTVFFSNEREAAKIATEYLIKNGHERIAYVKGKENSISTEERLAGFIEGLNNSNIKSDSRLIFSGNYSIKSGYDAMMEILNTKPRPSAVFCTNDNMALGALRCLNEKKIRVPDDFSIIGFDNTEYSEYLVPALTTINRPVKQIVKEAAKRLLVRIKDKENEITETVRKCFDSEIIYRESVKQIH